MVEMMELGPQRVPKLLFFVSPRSLYI